KSKTFRRAAKRLGGIFDYDLKSERLVEVNRELENPAIWNNPEKAQDLGRERVALDQIVSTLTKLKSGVADMKELLDMAVEENDEGAVAEVVVGLDKLDAEVSILEFRRMFSGKMDADNGYVDVQA